MSNLEVDTAGAGQRLDRWLAAQRPEHSRSRWQALVRAGCVQVNQRPAKPNQPLRYGDEVSYQLPPPRESTLVAEDLPLDILFEDEALLLLNKPAGLVVHPAPGHASGTLVNALLHHCPNLAGIGGERRPGIVHRLDKDTSGVMVVAKTEPAMQHLAAQFKRRRVSKEYLALAWGHPSPAAGSIKTTIGRSQSDRKKMAVDSVRGRRAVTHYDTLETLDGASLLRLTIETGRTHQIRVHLAHLSHPVLGDRTYGGKRAHPPGLLIARQMLHAHRLALHHPVTGDALEGVAPMPDDMETIRSALGGAPGR